MEQLEGLWLVQFKGIQGDGGGVAVFSNGRILGGDSGYYYVGNYVIDGTSLSGTIHVANFLPRVPNVLGIDGDFDLELCATLAEGEAKGNLKLVGRAGAGLAVRMVHRA